MVPYGAQVMQCLNYFYMGFRWASDAALSEPIKKEPYLLFYEGYDIYKGL